MSDLAVRCEGLVHVYGGPGFEVPALRGIDFEVTDGETVALLGPSGAGKSTLLWLLAGLLRPTAGSVELYGRGLRGLGSRELSNLRLRQVGVLMQNPGRNLLPFETALGNLLFAQRPTRRTGATKRKRSLALLDAVGLSGFERRRVGQLSGGEQQRLAVAVALANGPRLLLADEPTSQVDRESAAMVLELIQAANADLGTTVVAVTHDPAVGAALKRTVTIRDGRVGAEGRGGDEYLVIARDGTVQLPEDLFDVLPPGSLAKLHRLPDGAELRAVDPDQPVQPDQATQPAE